VDLFRPGFDEDSPNRFPENTCRFVARNLPFRNRPYEANIHRPGPLLAGKQGPMENRRQITKRGSRPGNPGLIDAVSSDN